MSDLVDDIYTFVFGNTVHRETIKYRPTYPGDGELAFDYYLKTPLGIWRSGYDKNYTEYIINSRLKIVVYFTEIAKNNTTIDPNLPRFLVDKSDVYMGIFTPISTGEWIAFAHFSQNNTRKISFRKKMVHNGEYIKEIIIMSDGTLVVNTYDGVSTTTRDLLINDFTLLGCPNWQTLGVQTGYNLLESLPTLKGSGTLEMTVV